MLFLLNFTLHDDDIRALLSEDDAYNDSPAPLSLPLSLFCPCLSPISPPWVFHISPPPTSSSNFTRQFPSRLPSRSNPRGPPGSIAPPETLAPIRPVAVAVAVAVVKDRCFAGFWRDPSPVPGSMGAGSVDPSWVEGHLQDSWKSLSNAKVTIC